MYYLLEVEELSLLEDAASPPPLFEPELSAKFFLLPDLKSVSYQPPPFKRKAAAETRFFNAD